MEWAIVEPEIVSRLYNSLRLPMLSPPLRKKKMERLSEDLSVCQKLANSMCKHHSLLSQLLEGQAMV